MYCALGLLPKWREGKKKTKEKRRKKKKGGGGETVFASIRSWGQRGHSGGPTRHSSCGTRVLLPCASASGVTALLPALSPKAFGGEGLAERRTWLSLVAVPGHQGFYPVWRQPNPLQL